MDVYFDYENNVLKNKPNITNADELAELEYKLTTIRTTELMIVNPPDKLTMQTYKSIHHHLFQDIYEWAGYYRSVNLSKGNTNFLSPQFFANSEHEIDQQISKYIKLLNLSSKNVCRELSKILIDLNYMHPFREGNGRTQREFIRQLAHVKGFDINISYNNKSYMKACIRDDEELIYLALYRSINSLKS